MNALLAIRSNAAGLLSPTPAKRREVIEQLKATTTALSTTLVTKSHEDNTTTASGQLDQELSREAFLELLVLQLQNQNPLEPINSQEMLSQLAQFSALEQMRNLNDSFDLFSGNLDQLNFIAASQLLGRTVRGIDVNGLPREGVVESVALDGSLVILTVDGEPMSMAGVLEIDAGIPPEPDPNSDPEPDPEPDTQP